MDLNTILGAAIAIIASILAYFFQSIESNKKHKWELEEKKKEREERVILNRIDQIEILVTEFFTFGSLPIGQLEQILQGEWESTGLIKGIDPLIKKYSLFAIPKILEDIELQIQVDNLEELAGEMLNLIGEVSTMAIPDKEKIGQLMDLSKKFEEPYLCALKRLDFLRKQLYSK